jgi:hypothetical protein
MASPLFWIASLIKREGLAPACLHEWTWTQCLSSARWSPTPTGIESEAKSRPAPSDPDLPLNSPVSCHNTRSGNGQSPRDVSKPRWYKVRYAVLHQPPHSKGAVTTGIGCKRSYGRTRSFRGGARIAYGLRLRWDTWTPMQEHRLFRNTQLLAKRRERREAAFKPRGAQRKHGWQQ